MDGQGDFDIDDLRGEIAMLRATVAGLRAAIDVIRAKEWRDLRGGTIAQFMTNRKPR